MITAFIASISTALLIAAAAWLGKNVIATRLVAEVNAEFNTKLETHKSELQKQLDQSRSDLQQAEVRLRAELQEKENEIAALRGGALTTMANRQSLLDQRRIKAADELWSGVHALAAGKAGAAIIASLNFQACLDEAENSEGFRKTFAPLVTDFGKLDLSGSAKARPFCTPMVWALYSAYSSVIGMAQTKLLMIKLGLNMPNVLKSKDLVEAVSAALPHQQPYLDQYGERGAYLLIDELENRLLQEIQAMIAGQDSDANTVERAAAILKAAQAARPTTGGAELEAIKAAQGPQ